jgi:negative regulator of flagellin synthesis FlgM
MSPSRLSRLMQLPLFRYDYLQRIVNDREASRLREAAEFQGGDAAMQVNGPGPVSGNTPIGRTEPTVGSTKPESTRPITPRDEVEISEVGRMFDQLSQSSAVRAERLAQIKAEIDAGTYDTPEKMEAALSKLFGEIGLDAGDE